MRYIALTDQELNWLAKQAGAPTPEGVSTRTPQEGDITAQGVMALRQKLMVAQTRDTFPLETAFGTAQRDGVYWYRRAEFAETALEEFVRFENWRDHLAELESAMSGAIAVLAERRKLADDFKHQNFEDYIRDRRQRKVLAWAIRTFIENEPDTDKPVERAFRFLEEAIELWHAVVAWDAEGNINEAMHERAMKLYARVVSKPRGAPGQEIGGTMVCLLSLAQVLGLSVSTEEKREFERVLMVPKAEFVARHQKKKDEGI